MSSAARLVASLAAAALLLWLAFGGIDLPAVIAVLRAADPRWIAAGIGLGFLGHGLRDLRWFVAVRELSVVSFADVFRVAQLGFLANVVLPFRLGDGLRAVLLSRVGSLGGARALGLVAVDRAADLAGLLVLLSCAAIALPALQVVRFPAGTLGNAEPLVLAPSLVRTAAVVLGAGVLLGVVSLWALATHRVDPAALPSARLRSVVGGVAEGLRVLRSSRASALLLSLSVSVWISGVASIACLLASLGLAQAWYIPVLVQAGIVLFVLAPVAPGLVGQFHIAVIASLLVATPGLGIDRAQAAALVVHAAALVPVGVLAVAASLLRRRSSDAGGATAT